MEEKKLISESEIRDKFLKYKRLAVEELSPDLFTKSDLSFVEEIINAQSKNNL